MSQHDQVIDNAPGQTVRTDINAAIAALFSSSSGPVEPVVKDPGQLWFDTSTPSIMRVAVRDQTNATWLNAVLAPSTLAAGDTVEASGPNAFVGVPGGAVHRAGDTMTGGLRITKPYAVAGDEALTIAPTASHATVYLQRAAGSGAILAGKTGANLRWQMMLGNTTAESGSNNGSDFSITRFNDAGVTIDAPFTIARANGTATFYGSMLCYGGNFVIRQLGATTPTIAQILDSGNTAKSQWYFNHTNNGAYVTNVVDGSNLGFVGKNISANPGAGGNFICASGLGFQTGGGPWTALSDIRIKTVESDYSQGLDAILALRPVNYKYKGNDSLTEGEASMHAGATDQTFIGLVAQEAEIPMPEMVGQQSAFIDGEAVDDLRTLNTGPLVFALINAVKQLHLRIAELEAAAGA